MKSIGEPRALQGWGADPCCGRHRHRLRGYARPDTLEGTSAPDDDGTIAPPEPRIGVERKGRDCVGILDNDVPEQRRSGSLLPTRDDTGRYPHGLLTREITGQHVEPVDGEIIEQQIIDGVERCADHPVPPRVD